MSKQKVSWHVPCVMVALALWAVSASAQTSYYVDPDWTGGTKNGAATTPWNSLDSGAWATINAALASADVTVYFSARNASSDTNQSTTAAINVSRTDTSTHRLTLDGWSMYNTNDTSPAWSAYTGSSKFQITASVPVSTGSVVQSNITVHGFRLIANVGQILYWRAGDNVIWEDNEGSSTGANSWGPGFYLQYSNAQSANCPTPNGDASCYPSTNLIIRRNYLHDTFGEALYVGGCEDVDNCYSVNGLTIENNTFVNPGIWPCASCEGGEAIDIKDGMRNLVVRGNTFIMATSGLQSRDGITTESGGLYERNYFQGAGSAGIYMSTYENNSGPTRDGTIIRNNIFVNSGGNPTYSYQAAIYVNNEVGWHTGGANDAWTNLKIYNNTIYLTTSAGGYNSYGIYVGGVQTPTGPLGVTLKNNVIAAAATNQLSAVAGSIASHDHNLFYSATSGATLVAFGGSSYTSATIANFEATALGSNPMFVSTATPYAAADFRLQSSSPALQAGTALADFSTDYFGVLRGTIWDMGAIQSSGVSPRSPFNVKILQD